MINEDKLSPSQRAKDAGLKSLAQVCEMTAVSPQTLINWHRDKPLLFSIVILGCATVVAFDEMDDSTE